MINQHCQTNDDYLVPGPSRPGTIGQAALDAGSLRPYVLKQIYDLADRCRHLHEEGRRNEAFAIMFVLGKLGVDVNDLTREIFCETKKGGPMKDGVNVTEATHVKIDGRMEKIASTWGIDKDKRLAKPSQGGFGVVTESGRRVDMWQAEGYGKEDE